MLMWRARWSKGMHHGLSLMGLLMPGPPESCSAHRQGKGSDQRERKKGGRVERDGRGWGERCSCIERERWQGRGETRKDREDCGMFLDELETNHKKYLMWRHFRKMLKLPTHFPSPLIFCMEGKMQSQLVNHLSFYEHTELTFFPCCPAVGLHLSAWLSWQVALLSKNADVGDTARSMCANVRW